MHLLIARFSAAALRCIVALRLRHGKERDHWNKMVSNAWPKIRSPTQSALAPGLSQVKTNG